MIFQERLAFIRGNMKMYEFAATLGVSKSTYTRYERGDSLPDLSFIQNLCAKYEINPRWLILGVGNMKDASAITDSPTEADVGYAPARDRAPHIDQNILRQVISGVEKGLAAKHLILDPERKAELISLLYDHFAEKEKVEEETVERFLRLVG